MTSSIKFGLAGLGVALIAAVALFLTNQAPSADSIGGQGRFGLIGRRSSGFAVGTLTKNSGCTTPASCATHNLKTSGGANPLWSAEFKTTALLDTLADYTTSHPNCIVRVDGLSLPNRTSTGSFPASGEAISASDAHLLSSSCSSSGTPRSGGLGR